ncbi:hypothetical protein, partial [Klebsiella pneumoniae]|uniref:hypothetical protein n=1 Tax=Klebsiella pneumoniae TaxID=573 RepID=UPI001D0DF7E6
GSTDPNDLFFLFPRGFLVFTCHILHHDELLMSAILARIVGRKRNSCYPNNINNQWLNEIWM